MLPELVHFSSIQPRSVQDRDQIPSLDWYGAVLYHYAHILLSLHLDLYILGESSCGRLIEAVFGNGSQLENLSLAGHETTFEEFGDTVTNLAVLPLIHTLKLACVRRNIRLRTLLLACPSVAHVEVENKEYHAKEELSMLTIAELCPQLRTLCLSNFPFPSSASTLSAADCPPSIPCLFQELWKLHQSE